MQRWFSVEIFIGNQKTKLDRNDLAQPLRKHSEFHSNIIKKIHSRISHIC